MPTELELELYRLRVGMVESRLKVHRVKDLEPVVHWTHGPYTQSPSFLYICSELIVYHSLKCRFGTAMLYYSISIYSSSFTGDRFSNMAWGSLVEFPSFIIVYFLLRYLGRPRTGLLLMFLCGVSSIVLPHVPAGILFPFMM